MINPKELMLGNWVYLNESSKYPMQVVDISQDMIYLDFDGNEGDAFYGIPKDICPIPLKEEILLKNGFIESVYEKGKYHQIQIPTDDDFTILYKVGEWFAVRFIDRFVEIKYVHQLQNILKITGMEINFKI